MDFETLYNMAANAARNAERMCSQGGGSGDATATIAITASTPDEARLAVLDLDITADEVRGKILRWDNEAMAWRADSRGD